MRDKVMIIEDERKIAEAIAYALTREGYQVEVVTHGESAIKRIAEFIPHAIILDVMLPGMDGYEILKRLQDKKRTGVIMLTAKEDIVNKVLGLELGADDYMTKPFDMRELLARLKSLLRRMQAAGEQEEPKELVFGDLVMQVSRRTAYAGDRRLELTNKEYDLLVQLLSSPDRVYTRDQLLNLVWGMDYIGGTRTVDIHIQRVRKKLGDDYSELIQTVHGVGYKVLGGYRENQY
ncbi:response regulator transcription factor [Gorillibacterium sp. CAU 1737]|uniref:response regulator transcription factor n=1 Tax=Gorillibacterium sp. CAU 1737 TaxID=3140362 RepID=UPI0032608FD0